MTTKISTFDISEYLNDEKTIAAYLSEILEEGDSTLLLAAIGDIAKARGMANIAIESGLGRESLYKALNADAKPRFDTVLKVLGAIGVGIKFDVHSARKSKGKVSRPVLPIRKSKLPQRRPGAMAIRRAGQKKKT